MTWFRVDDGLYDHPKISELEDGPCFAEAIALWTLAGAWSAKHLTDGYVPRNALRRVTPYDATRAAEELVRVGLWIEADRGWRFRDWTDWQPTKAEVSQRREKTRERVAKHRARKKECNGVTNAVITPTVTVPPARPDPTNLSRGGGGNQDCKQGGDRPGPVKTSPPPPPDFVDDAPWRSDALVVLQEFSAATGWVGTMQTTGAQSAFHEVATALRRQGAHDLAAAARELVERWWTPDRQSRIRKLHPRRLADDLDELMRERGGEGEGDSDDFWRRLQAQREAARG